MIFEEYAQYYDLLYSTKDYEGEAQYIDEVIKKYINNADTILDLGCGTGKHAKILARKGYQVHGIDRSENMLIRAKKSVGNEDSIEFSCADLQEFNLNKTFDVVTALFHVMSYQITDEGIDKIFLGIRKHLNKGGIFLFDCWYGPTVLYEKPEVRIKRLENENIEVVRIADPVLKENENIVDVYYELFIKDKLKNNIKSFKEIHCMRYFFRNEIKKIGEKHDFQLLGDFEFMTGKKLGKNTWGSCFVMGK